MFIFVSIQFHPLQTLKKTPANNVYTCNKFQLMDVEIKGAIHAQESGDLLVTLLDQKGHLIFYHHLIFDGNICSHRL